MKYPKIHKRAKIVQAAETKMLDALGIAVEEYDLTFGEIFAILARLGAHWSKIMIRAERHPNDPDQPGDLEEA